MICYQDWGTFVFYKFQKKELNKYFLGKTEHVLLFLNKHLLILDSIKHFWSFVMVS